MTEMQPFEQCRQRSNFVRVVVGSTGEYTVSHGKTPHGPYEYGWHCTCKAYSFSRGMMCKHIKEVEHLLCFWHGQFDEPQKETGVCPVCEGPTEIVMCAV